MVKYKEQIRYLFMKFACEGVTDPAKAFKMTMAQFGHMCEKLKHTDSFTKEEACIEFIIDVDVFFRFSFDSVGFLACLVPSARDSALV